MEITESIQDLFLTLYRHQILSCPDVKKMFKLTDQEMEQLILDDYLSFAPSLRFKGALVLEPKALHLIYDWLDVPKDLIAHDGTLLKRNRPRASRQRPHPKVVNRQLQLNAFVFELMEQLNRHHLPYRYYDYKHLPETVNPRPHGLFELNGMELHLYSVDKESVLQQDLRMFETTYIQEANQGTYEKPRLILYLTAHPETAEFVSVAFNQLTQKLERNGLSFFSLTYDNPLELETVMKEFILPSETPYFPLQAIEKTFALYDHLNQYSFLTQGFYGYYDRQLKEKDQDYLFLDYRFPHRTEAKVTIRCHRENLKTYFNNQPIPLIVLLPDETPYESSYDYLEHHLDLILWNDPLVYFTTPQDLTRSRSLSDAIFQFNQTGERRLKH